MNVREAILKAADHIERHPDDFNFGVSHKPHGCGTPGCALGWIGYFAGLGDHEDYTGAVSHHLSTDELSFYQRMNMLDLVNRRGRIPGFMGGWMWLSAQCATVLRLYADKYHPAPKPLGIPDSVRAIFDATQSVAA